MTIHRIENVKALLPGEGLVDTSIEIDGGIIRDIGSQTSTTAEALDGGGLIAFPGIVDIHGDAFERQIMPRPNVSFRLDVALHDTDRQMVANGITTAYHGVTYSWEPGLRGRGNCMQMLDGVKSLQSVLGCDTHIHLRFETFNLDGVEEVIGWMESGMIGMLAFNDHTPKTIEFLDEGNSKIKRDLDRSGLPLDEFTTLARSVYARKEEVPLAIEKLAAAAIRNGIPQLSHDDYTPEMRRSFHALGCEVSEFPMNIETAQAARSLGNPIVLGAPNVMRGGSHNGAVNAKEMIQEDMCNILASDYYYPAPLFAAFRLVEEGVLDWEQAWNLISLNPARAAGLVDRGDLKPGQRADIVLVDAEQTEFPRIVATISKGRFVHRAIEMAKVN